MTDKTEEYMKKIIELLDSINDKLDDLLPLKRTVRELDERVESYLKHKKD
jgi:uncharacterized protein YoxC